VALLWGMSHVLPGGFPRFVAPTDRVLALLAIGGRQSALETPQTYLTIRA